MFTMFSKRAFAFGEGITRSNPEAKHVEVKANAFTSVPDWVKNDRLFQMAERDSLVYIVNSSNANKIENDAADAGANSGAAYVSEDDAYKAELKTKTRAELETIAGELGVEVNESESVTKLRNRIFAAYINKE